MTIKTADILQLYLFGSSKPPKKEDAFQIQRYYSNSELDELELEPDRIHDAQDSKKNILNYLNTDWDTGRGSLRNSAVALFDAFFSSLGNGISALCPDYVKIALSLKVFLGSLVFNNDFFKNIKKDISINTFAGRLIRSPFHIFDSLFSVSGQVLSKNTFFAPFALSMSGLGVLNSYLNKKSSALNPEIHYANIPGTLGRSALHQFSSCLSNKLSEICNKNIFLNTILAGLSLIGFQLTPQSFKKHDISWKNLDGLLAQNIFHMSDSIFASLGTNVFKLITNSSLALGSILAGTLGLAISTNFVKSQKLLNFLNEEFVFTRVDSKFYRSITHLLDSLVFNIGTKLGSTRYAGSLSLVYVLGVAGADGFVKNLNSRKISMNTFAGLAQRLPFDFVEAIISSSSNRLASKIPPFIGVLLGPALSFRFGELLKNKSTQFNTLAGLLNKHLIHFWDNLMSTSGYNFGQALIGLVSNKEKFVKGSLLSDGKWITPDGRIVPKMVLGQQL